MALSRTAPPRAAALVSAAAASGTALAGPALPAYAFSASSASSASSPVAAQTVTTHAAASTLITVTVAGVPALSVGAFQGSYATSAVAQNGGDASADGAQDPTGVLDRLTLDRPAQSKAHSDPAENWADAQPAVEYSLHGKKLYSVSSVDAHAACPSSASGAGTYVHTAPDSVKVLGTTIPLGKTTVPVTGAQLGVSGVARGSLKVTYTTTAMQEQQTAVTTAHAHLDLSISGVFYNNSGKQLYSGLVQKLRLGDVQVACQDSGTSSSSAPTTTPSTPGSPSTSTSASPKAGSGPDSAPGPAVPSTLARHGRHANHQQVGGKAGAGAGAPQNGPMLHAANTAKTTASGGDGSAWWALLSVLGLGSGAGLYFATRKRGRHQ